MERSVIYIFVCAILGLAASIQYTNETVPDPASQQLAEFRFLHPKPIGVLTKLSGEPVDLRDTITINSDVFLSRNHFRVTAHNVRERIPERVVHAKGVAAFGYFEVTHDVSKYIKSDVFNEIGKRTPVVARFSTALQNLGGNDLARETKAMSLKMYTREGNLDLIALHLPIFLYKDPILFQKFLHAFKRNPRTNLMDPIARWDFTTQHVDHLHTLLWLASDFGLPDGYGRMDAFAEHVYEVYNKKGDQYYVKFNFRTEKGLANLTDAQAQAIGIREPDYFNRDLYNTIALKNYPSWRLELDILTKEDLLKVDYDPFDMTRLWKRGTYRTVTVGRLVFNQRVDNFFKDSEISAFSPDNLVPGIKGPYDVVFRARKIFYSDTQNYRLGVNHDNTNVNAPLYDRVYNRDGRAPVLHNMRDAPNYFPNSFNGPMPYVDEARSTESIEIFHSNAIDLQPMAEFYNEIVDSDAHRQRLATRLAESIVPVPLDIEHRVLRILKLISRDLGRRVRDILANLRTQDIQERRSRVAQCIAEVTQVNISNDTHILERYSHILSQIQTIRKSKYI